METLNKLIIEAVDRKPTSMKETFKKAIADKVAEALEIKKIEVAESFGMSVDKDTIVDTFEDDLGVDGTEDDLEDDESEQEDQEDEEEDEEDEEEEDEGSQQDEEDMDKVNETSHQKVVGYLKNRTAKK